MVTAHEADLLYMRNFLEEKTKNKYNQGGWRATRRASCLFVNGQTSSHRGSNGLTKISKKLLSLAAQMQEWDKDKFIAEAQQGY